MLSSLHGAHKELGVNASVLRQPWGGQGVPRIWTLPGLQPRCLQSPSSPAAALINRTTVANVIQADLFLVKKDSHFESNHFNLRKSI